MEISRRIGIQRCSKATGLTVGMMPLCGTVVTEVQALALLGAEDVFPIYDTSNVKDKAQQYIG